MTTPNYKHPSFKQQLGLSEDPNGSDHVVTSKGHRLTRTLTVGGHEVDSSQPGFPVYHRRIANPVPLLSISTGASLLMLGLLLIEVRGITNSAIIMSIALPLGMIGNLTACMYAFADGSTYLATVCGTLGSLIGGSALLFLPWTGVQSAYIVGGATQANPLGGVEEFYKAIAMTYFVSLIPIFLILLGSFRTSVPIAGAALTIVIAMAVFGSAYVDGSANSTLMKASGGLFIFVGVALFYSALSVMLAEEGVKLLPVFLLPRNE
ncbi:uncharacterized protein MEPE_06499 [Melanopsichium pennsylvanicum]|uniref:Uncharacterized protein n=2 Tax=Melanopsichium pennsylvanicum TaxID=63383 RepID=A0AAJ4XUC5_9BASI|nr:probable fun34-transmembrane protein involved in ammonia production [Melanopsichium pennsylvanicum 4]SNX87788.1 uncharacterized protein MEPE_06499 [Melanopsichium pennsylvanicum]